MTKIKLLTALFFLCIISFYGDGWGMQPKVIGIALVLAQGSLFGIIISLLQIWILIMLIYTAIAKPYYKNEKVLFYTTVVVLGGVTVLHFFELYNLTLTKGLISAISLLLFCSALYVYRNQVFKKDAMEKNEEYIT